MGKEVMAFKNLSKVMKKIVSEDRLRDDNAIIIVYPDVQYIEAFDDGYTFTINGKEFVCPSLRVAEQRLFEEVNNG